MPSFGWQWDGQALCVRCPTPKWVLPLQRLDATLPAFLLPCGCFLRNLRCLQHEPKRLVDGRITGKSAGQIRL